MSIVDAIERLVYEYKGKQQDCDKLLGPLTIRISVHRRNGDDIQDFRKEQAVINARRQAYVQAESDIDGLLDYIEFNKE